MARTTNPKTTLGALLSVFEGSHYAQSEWRLVLGKTVGRKISVESRDHRQRNDRPDRAVGFSHSHTVDIVVCMGRQLGNSLLHRAVTVLCLFRLAPHFTTSAPTQFTQVGPRC